MKQSFSALMVPHNYCLHLQLVPTDNRIQDINLCFYFSSPSFWQLLRTLLPKHKRKPFPASSLQTLGQDQLMTDSHALPSITTPACFLTYPEGYIYQWPPALTLSPKQCSLWRIEFPLSSKMTRGSTSLL